MKLLRKKKTECDREKMLRYLNRFKLKKKQIKYKPRTYANLQGINSLRSQNTIDVEPPRPVIKESVKARLDCNLNALLQLDNEKKWNNNIKQRIKPQESYINMELNVTQKHPKQNPQHCEVELELEQDLSSKSVISELALDLVDSDYRSDFEACFETQTDELSNLRKNHLLRDRKASSLSRRLKKQRKIDDEHHEIIPLLTNAKVNIPPKQKTNREKVFGSNNCTRKEIAYNPDDSFECFDDNLEFDRPDVSHTHSNHSINEHFQSKRTKQKEHHQNDVTFDTQKYRQDDWKISTPSKSSNHRSKNRYIFQNLPSKSPSIIYSDGRFSRNQNKKMTENTRGNPMLDNVFEESLHKNSLHFERTAPETKQRFDSSCQSQLLRNKNNAFINTPSTILSTVGSEYVKSWDTIRNGVKAGHGKEPPTLSRIPDKVFFDQPIHYELSSSEFSWQFSGSNVLSALSSFAQSISAPKRSKNARPSLLAACFTRNVIMGRNGQNAYEQIIYQELRN